MAPRYRWIKLFLIAYAVAISVVIAVLIVMRQHDPPQDRQPITIVHCILGLVATFIISFVVVGISFAWRQYPMQLELEQLQTDQNARATKDADGHDYPGVIVIPNYSPATDVPGRYRVSGVNRNTQEDATMEVHADSLANAKVKAELNGLIVTSITKIA